MPSTENFRLLLDEHYSWPCSYTFKFIVPKERVETVEKLLEGASIMHRPSKNGRYISVNATRTMASAEDVMAVYERASAIDGLIAL